MVSHLTAYQFVCVMIEQTSVSSVIHSLRIFGFKTLPNWLDAVWLKRESCEEHREKNKDPARTRAQPYTIVVEHADCH